MGTLYIFCSIFLQTKTIIKKKTYINFLKKNHAYATEYSSLEKNNINDNKFKTQKLSLFFTFPNFAFLPELAPPQIQPTVAKGTEFVKKKIEKSMLHSRFRSNEGTNGLESFWVVKLQHLRACNFTYNSPQQLELIGILAQFL